MASTMADQPSTRPIESVKEDWGIVKKRFEYWWANELYDRALVSVTAPRDGIFRKAASVPPTHTPGFRWTDVDYRIEMTLAFIDATYFGGESLPMFHPNMSVGYALVFGAEPVSYAEDTIWTAPIWPGDQHPPVRFDGQNHWWKWMQDYTARAARASEGRYFVMPTYGNQAADTLSLLRGIDNFLLDTKLSPEWTRQSVKTVSDAILFVQNRLRDLAAPGITGIEGYVNYGGLWSPTPTGGADCDLLPLISPQTFQGLFFPPLRDHMRSVDTIIYHLDGPTSLHHLDFLLTVPEINAIQWCPVPQNTNALEWVPLIRKVQAAGKSIVFNIRAEDVGPLLSEVPARGLCLMTECDSERDARDLLRLAAAASW
jgi:hypothetical protein